MPAEYPRPPEALVTPPPPPLRPPAPSSAYEQAPVGDEVSPEVRRWADLRKQVAYRCKRINTGHMVEADQRFGQPDAIGPHGVVLFFVSDALAEPHGYQLHTAYRLWLASPEADDLPRLLADLAEVASENIARGASTRRRWHPLGPDGSMVNGGDMSLPHGSTYVGVGVSTLDSDQGRWYQLAHTLRDLPATGRRLSVFDLKGQCYVLLTDGTAMHIDRDPHARLGVDGIRCNRTLDPDRVTYFNRHENLTEDCDEAIRHVWRQLGALDRTLTAHLHSRRPVRLTP
ncbi:hypothetical protein [Micromonospora cremea]|uniref:Uncharacterized protein n=1 Tax=Micromonospora cremea TaxID=709881 RepID=A0A1N5TZF3_9ACTN|nr:hypothetical protein [Micromonospora cremea]SIM53129.1 hypothetical protein SAMN04489832_0444 [Micromonospora cremea]